MVTCYRLFFENPDERRMPTPKHMERFHQVLLDQLDRDRVFDIEVENCGCYFFTVTLSHLYVPYCKTIRDALISTFYKVLGPDGFTLKHERDSNPLRFIANDASEQGKKSYYAVDCRFSWKEEHCLSLCNRYIEDSQQDHGGCNGVRGKLKEKIWWTPLWLKLDEFNENAYLYKPKVDDFRNLFENRTNGKDLLSVANKVYKELLLSNKLTSVFAVKKKCYGESINYDRFNKMTADAIDLADTADKKHYEYLLESQEDDITTRLWWVAEALKIGGVLQFNDEANKHMTHEYFPWFNNSLCIAQPEHISDFCTMLLQYAAGNILVIDTDNQKLIDAIKNNPEFIEKFHSKLRQTAIIFLYSANSSAEIDEEITIDPKNNPFEESVSFTYLLDILRMNPSKVIKVNTYTPIKVYIEACDNINPEMRQIWMEVKTEDFKDTFESARNEFIEICEKEGSPYNRLSLISDFREFCNEKFFQFCRIYHKDAYGMLNWSGTLDNPDEYDCDNNTDWLKELDSHIGLANVKNQIHKLVYIMEYRDKRKCLKSAKSRMVFTFEGNPGCGKSSIARIFANCLMQAGIITNKPAFVKISVGELVGVHLGEAANTVNNMFKVHEGSLIFIDEAYALLDNDQYGRSAIAAIIDNISTMSPNTVLVFAGYPKDIQRLLKANPGFESRVTARIRFDNYSADELYEILIRNLETRYGYIFHEEDKERIKNDICEFILEASSCNASDAGKSIGNARFIDNLMFEIDCRQAAYCKHLESTNAGPLDTNQLQQISYETVISPLLKELREILKTDGNVLGSKRPLYFQHLTDEDTFDNIVGNTEAKQQLCDVLRNPQIKSRGILLTGAPGCGKTSLAKAFAHESKSAFFALGASDLLRGYTGQSKEAAEELFAALDEYTNCTLFLDEIDLIGSREKDQANTDREILNVLLNHLGGINSNRKNNLFVIAATNCPDNIDPALRRRLGLQVIVTLPEYAERLELLNRCLAKSRELMSVSVSADKLQQAANELQGESYDTIVQIVKSAERFALRNTQPLLDDEVLNAAIDYQLMGNISSIKLRSEENKHIAIHELGHAALSIKNGNNPANVYVSIVPRASGALGVTKTIPDSIQHLYTRADIEKQITQALAGRAAEEVFYGSDGISTGCADDLQKANELCLHAILYTSSHLRLRDTTDTAVQSEQEELLKIYYAKAKSAIEELKDKFEQCVTILVQKSVMSGSDIQNILFKV